MAKEQLEMWEHIVVIPCYANYPRFKRQVRPQLHSSWTEAMDNKDSLDLELRVQAWQDMMAIAKIFRERFEWDTKKRCPKPLVTEVPEVVGKPMWITNGLQPATAAWMEHWKAFPKEQPSMARHAKRQWKKNGGI
jgi:hypothetical protein